MRLQVLKLTVAITSAITVAACGGLVVVEAYDPIQVDKPDPKIYRPHAMVRLDDASIVLFPVVVSERLQRIYGPALILPVFWEDQNVMDKPLRLEIWLQLPRGDAIVDLSAVSVRLGDRALYPSSVRSLWTGERFEAPVTLMGQKIAHMFELNYELLTTQLEPFTLHLPDIRINGRVARVDPIAFRPARRESPRYRRRCGKSVAERPSQPT